MNIQKFVQEFGHDDTVDKSIFLYEIRVIKNMYRNH